MAVCQATVLHQRLLRDADYLDCVDERQKPSGVDRQRTDASYRSDDRLQHGRPTVLGGRGQERYRVL